MDEFRLIERFFLRESKSSKIVVGIGDDGAVVNTDSNEQIVLVTDTLVAGVHFPEKTTPEDVGYKLLAGNLSDLAAMGANPVWFLVYQGIQNSVNKPKSFFRTKYSRQLDSLIEHYLWRHIGTKQ